MQTKHELPHASQWKHAGEETPPLAIVAENPVHVHGAPRRFRVACLPGGLRNKIFYDVVLPSEKNSCWCSTQPHKDTWQLGIAVKLLQFPARLLTTADESSHLKPTRDMLSWLSLERTAKVVTAVTTENILLRGAPAVKFEANDTAVCV